MSTMSLRLPESLHRKVRELAEQEGRDASRAWSAALGSRLHRSGATRSRLRFRRQREGITPDGRRSYYAITSHRRLGASHERRRRLLRFRIVDDLIVELVSVDLTRLDSTSLGYFRRTEGIQIDDARWSREDDDSENPFGFEIEGIAFRDNQLLLGLKWPLIDARALVIAYDPVRKRFVRAYRLNLNGLGISALEVFGDILYVGANPPGQEPVACEGRFTGRAELYGFRFVTGGIAEDPIRPGVRDIVAQDCAKLEGIVFVSDVVVLSFDGNPSSFRVLSRERIDELFR